MAYKEVTIRGALTKPDSKRTGNLFIKGKELDDLFVKISQFIKRKGYLLCISQIKENKIISFAPGDVVEDKKKEQHIIVEAFPTQQEGNIKYSISPGGAWYYHRDFKLLHRATDETLRKALEYASGDDDDEDDDENE